MHLKLVVERERMKEEKPIFTHKIYVAKASAKSEAGDYRLNKQLATSEIFFRVFT
jgi:hypothetical protein